MALAFAREGADVLFTHLPEEEQDARETAALVEGAGRRAVAVARDIRSEDECRALVDRAVREFGINSTSVQACKPSPHLLDYAMTKGAVVTFTQGLAQTVAEDGVRVDAVAPGPVWTPLIPATMPDTSEFGKQSPLGRPAQPAEMAPAYVFLAFFLASSRVGYLTAEILDATGGTPLP